MKTIRRPVDYLYLQSTENLKVRHDVASATYDKDNQRTDVISMGLLRVQTYNNPWGIFISVMLDLGWLPRLPSTQVQRTGGLSLVSGAEFALPLIRRYNAVNQTIIWNVSSS